MQIELINILLYKLRINQSKFGHFKLTKQLQINYKDLTNLKSNQLFSMINIDW